MSGSGGGGDWRPNPKAKGGSAGSTGGEISDACNIVEVTSLNSVDRAIASALRANDELSVEFQPGPPQRLVAQTATGQIVGSITSPSMLQIIQCIQDGVVYRATVVSVRGAQCQVRIEPQ